MSTALMWRCELCGEKLEGHAVSHTVRCFAMMIVELTRLRMKYGKLKE